MEKELLNQLHAEGILSDPSFAKARLATANKLLSVHWELKTLLYLGVLLLSSGLGILVYKNIDTIGHQVILLFIALVCAGSYAYCSKHKLPFSVARVASPNGFFDYVLVLACSTFIIFIAYLQYQYNVFGNRYGLATFFPMIVLFFSAYYFDHLGVLSMAITNLAAWLGITITPLRILQDNDFNSSRIIFTGLFLGVLLIATGWISYKRNFKKHFEFTYTNFGLHLLSISSLAALFVLYPRLLWFVLLLGVIYFFYVKALKDKSFYFILVIALYGYVGISYMFLSMLDFMGGFGMAMIYLAFLYFIMSAVGLIFFLIKTNKKIKAA
jgi:hypothetical protein